MKLDITIPTIITNKELYLQMLTKRIIQNIQHINIKTTVKLYAHDINIDTGYTLKWSTNIFKIYEIQKCISNYLGMSEQYGESLTNSVMILSKLQFNQLDEYTYKILNNINKDINDKFKLKPNKTNNEIYNKLIQTLENLSNSLILQNESINKSNFINRIINLGQSQGYITTNITTNTTTKKEINTTTNINKLQELEIKLKQLTSINNKTKEIKKDINKVRAHIRYYKLKNS